MKARVKGTDDPFRDIETVEIKGIGYSYSAKDVEFEQESNTSDHWQDVRERAAIAVIQAYCAAPVNKCTESMTIDDAAKFAVKIADALVKKLKGV